MQARLYFFVDLRIATSLVPPPNEHFYGVVLGGGKDERLWLLRGKNKPKQFLAFLVYKTLIEYAINRVPSLNLILTHYKYNFLSSKTKDSMICVFEQMQKGIAYLNLINIEERTL